MSLRRDAFGTCLISLTPFIFMLLISTVSYSVKVYGPDTETENIMSMAVRIEGDERETKFKDLTNKATEGYDMYASVFCPTGGAPVGDGKTSWVIIAPVWYSLTYLIK